MEAMLAAHGSGAVHASYDRHERVINVDIGGGTTKLSIIENGNVLITAALHIGGRLIAVDPDGVIKRLEPAGQAYAKRAGFSWQMGDQVKNNELDIVADSMADDLVSALTVPDPATEILDLYLTDPISGLNGISSVVFSGGVAEFVYKREPRDFGDLGNRLGLSIRQRVDSGILPWCLIEDSEGIRATVLGASEYSTQLSGNTSYIGNAKSSLPRRNLQVMQTEFDFTINFDGKQLADTIRRNMQKFDLIGTEADLVLAFHWQGHPDYQRVRALADGINAGIEERISRNKTIYIILDADIAMNLGRILKEDLAIKNDLLVIDGLALWNFDYIDLGRMREPSNTVPVMIKSLVFKDVSDGKHRLERLQSRQEITVEQG